METALYLVRGYEQRRATYGGSRDCFQDLWELWNPEMPKPVTLRSEYLHTTCTCPLVCFKSPVSHLCIIRDAVQMAILLYYLGNNGRKVYVLSPNATVLKDLSLFMYMSAKCAQVPSEARGGRRVPLNSCYRWLWAAKSGTGNGSWVLWKRIKCSHAEPSLQSEM